VKTKTRISGIENPNAWFLFVFLILNY